jgi:hypothetical protein
MTVSTERLLEVGETFAGLWDDADLAAVTPLYREDAVFISPNPPAISSEFGTTLTGRDEILRYLGACLEMFGLGAMTTVGIFTGIDMLVLAWRGGDSFGADVVHLDDDGLIVRHEVTSPNRS